MLRHDRDAQTWNRTSPVPKGTTTRAVYSTHTTTTTTTTISSIPSIRVYTISSFKVTTLISFRKVLHDVMAKTYTPVLTMVTPQEVVRLCYIDPNVDILCNSACPEAIAAVDLRVLDIILVNVVSNAVKYNAGPQRSKLEVLKPSQP